jgi:OmcA/MtrC family decaheme c-type cytochrome
MQAKTTLHNGFINNLYADAATAPPACTNCHDGSTAPTFATIHNGGMIKAIADSAGNKTASIFTVTVDSAVQTASTVRVSFSATKGAAAAELDPTTVGSIVPTILVGIYGYDTKDFLVDAHTNVNGVRNLEFVWGGTHPRFKNPSYSNGTWSIDVGLGDFATQLATSGRFEVAVLPKVIAPDGTVLAVNAPSKTFKAGAGTLATVAKTAIVDATKCNKCHEALGSTFHTPDRGGNVVVCRLCHNTRNGAVHLEMQSRSIDSFVHAIHSFQVFDIATIDPANPVSAMRYTHHTESGYPNFTLTNCESCHTSGSYNPPANDKSLPGIVSAAANVAVRGSWTAPGVALSNVASNIGTVPAYVTGPAARACGACHRAEKIKENDAASLTAFIDHTDAMGYMLTNGTGVLDAAITKVMSYFR